jgi:hypothetical protein
MSPRTPTRPRTIEQLYPRWPCERDDLPADVHVEPRLEAGGSLNRHQPGVLTAAGADFVGYVIGKSDSPDHGNLAMPSNRNNDSA